ncbi:MAG: hypothetical protein ACLVLH_19670 [Eisenbergiella massiliensis]
MTLSWFIWGVPSYAEEGGSTGVMGAGIRGPWLFICFALLMDCRAFSVGKWELRWCTFNRDKPRVVATI